MLKKFLALGIAGLTTLVLVSCGPKPPAYQPHAADSTDLTLGASDKSKSQNVRVALQYYAESTSMGITVQRSGGVNIDNKTYAIGDLTPTWKAISDSLKINFNDVTNHQITTGNNGQLAEFTKNGGYNSTTDLFYNTSANMVQIQDNLVPLNKYFGYMPNYYKFLQDRPQVMNQLRASDQNIYISPYFDGLDDVEKMFLMNVDYVKALLDDNPNYVKFGSTPVYAPKAPSYDTDVKLDPSAYKPYVESFNNEVIDVVNKAGNGVTTVKLNMKKGEDIITKMNALSDKNGANLVAALKAHIDDVYGSNIGSGKLWEQRSDIFTSAQACYTADLYIALLRCVKTNPKYLSGKASIDPFVTRTKDANRQQALVSIAQLWGVRGNDAEKDKLWFNKDGKLVDGRTQEANYDALQNVRYMYQEGLIVQGLTKTESYSGSAPRYKDGTGFAAYDYNATSTIYNKAHDSSYETTGLMPILPPVARWDDGSSRTYSRFTEDTRQLKTEGWVLVNRPGRTEAETIRALELIDAFFDRDADGYDVTKGTSIADLQDYGPNTSFFRGGTVDVVDKGKAIKTVKIPDTVFNAISDAKLGWNNFYRMYIGATLGVGHVRSMGLDYQVTSVVGRYGLDNINKAVDLGVLKMATSYGEKFFLAVPTNWGITTEQNSSINNNQKVKSLADIWANSSDNISQYTTIVMKGFENAGTSIPTRAVITSYFTEVNQEYLKVYQALYEKSISKELDK